MSFKSGVGIGVPFGFSVGAASSGALATGVYWASGLVSLAPSAGNYAPTSLLSDADMVSGETGSAGDITVVHSLAAPISIASWNATFFYKGAPTVTYYYWDGAMWKTLLDTSGVAWAALLGYTSVTRVATFSGAPSARYFRVTLHEDDTSEGNAKISDSHVS